VTWEQLHYPAGLSAAVRDLWLHKNLASAKGQVGAEVGRHAVVMLTIKP
jgi:alpha-galactosidase